jgi:hypothetical protein
MMKKLIPSLLLLICISTDLFSQVTLYTKYDSGSFLSHTDNSLTILKDKELSKYSGYSIGARFDLFSLKFQAETGYFSAESKGLLFVRTLNEDGQYIGVSQPDLFISSFPMEFFYIPYSNDWFLFGAGPSMVITNRKLQLSYNDNEKFIDKINSVGFGFAIFADLRLQPFNDLENLYFFIGVKYRKINSVSMTKDGRKYGDYKIDFSQRQFNLGFSWAL